jgi:hypothetical protein
MGRQLLKRRAGHLLLCLTVVMASLLAPSPANAQVQQGATLTILRGQVAIIRADGTAIQPAASGSTVAVGDEIRTITKSGALITFFAGTEIEMGEETILVVEQLSNQGDKIDISLRQAFGATLNRVQSIAGSGSTYQIQAGGAVALVRGTTFSLTGPVTTPSGNVVATACLADCSPASTFNNCAMHPHTGIGVTVAGGKVESGCHEFPVDRTQDLFSAGAQAVTTVQQAVQGDTRGVPAGQIAAGGKNEAESKISQQQVEQQQRDTRPTGTDGGPLTPQPGHTSPGTQPCNTSTVSGGFGTTTTVHNLGQNSGTFNFSLQARSQPDRFQIIYQGNTLLDTGFVSFNQSYTVTYSGTSPLITVIVEGSGPGTLWDYLVACPT